ncbi:DUF1835 domain-containing protein [Pseudomonas sichuanensis]|uniref:DUF1835 domain-containing protein n=1 Tax=Pseudomonas sichuanensis TaxID=2213015 RepID=UPI002ABCE94C|nr:DUF1835 domain-containing protein [Pseudomonas sichuanensis]MDZ4017188.1 hypothetical protein [Pseudomonas sichuanensis]
MPAIHASRHHGLIDLPALRKRAKRLLKTLDDETCAQLRALGLPGPEYRLADTQWLVAREAGFPSWPKLKAHADAVDFAARHPGFACDGEAQVQHWRCGNDIEHSLRIAGFTGAFHMFDDPMVMGPVPALPEAAYWQVRTEYVLRAFKLPAQDIEQRHARQRAALAQLNSDSEMVLWCEADAYDQLFLIRVLASLPCLPRRLELIETCQVPGVQHFVGIGQLAPDVLAWLWPQRRVLGEDALALARQAWAAYTAPDPRAWAQLASRPHSALPLLQGALARQLQELPGAEDGLSLTERLTLRILARLGEQPAARVFAELMANEEPLPYLGDMMFGVLLRPLIDSPRPLLLEGEGDSWQQRQLRLTALGEQVLGRQANWLDQQPAERWVGGVRIAAGQAPWVVNEAGQVWQR